MRWAPWLAVCIVMTGCVENADEPPTSTSPAVSSGELGASLPQATSVWTTKALFPEPRGEVACTSIGNKLYAFGGFIEQRGQSPRLDIYDLEKDQWSRAPDAPVGFHHTQIVAYKGDLYVPGGYVTLGYQGTNTFFKFSLATNTWSTLPLMPHPRGAHAAVVLGDELYVIGGREGGPPARVLASVDIFNFTTSQWRGGPAMSVAREHIAAAVAGGEIVVFGGRPGAMNLTESLRPGEATWRVVSPMPTARSGSGAAAWDDEILVFGGEMPGVFEQVEGYNVKTKTWREHPPMPTPRHGMCAAQLPDGIHVVAGGVEVGFSPSQHHEVLTFPPGS